MTTGMNNNSATEENNFQMFIFLCKYLTVIWEGRITLLNCSQLLSALNILWMCEGRQIDFILMSHKSERWLRTTALNANCMFIIIIIISNM